MADYFVSDVHIRLDRPDRGRRFAQLVDRLGPDDRLTIVGDLCDFWFAARQHGVDPMTCRGLAALARFRDRGGSTTILAGNHDAWLGPFFERTLGACFVPDSIEVNLQGLRTQIAHGHRLKAHTPWKTVLESRLFLGAFRRLPGPVATALGAQLKRTNARHQEEFDRRGLDAYREYVSGLGDRFDLVILGHVHSPLDTGPGRPRLVVLGGWHHLNCYLMVKDGIATHVVEPASREPREERAGAARGS